MPWDLSPFADIGLSGPLLETLLGEHESRVRPALERLWSYYRNPMRPAGGVAFGAARPGAFGGIPGHFSGPTAARMAQAAGLPERLRSPLDAAGFPSGPREIVIENDIAWRIDTLVDFLFGKPVRFASRAHDEGLRKEIEAALARAWEESGGQALLLDVGLLGCVYGSADLVLRGTGRGDDTPRVEVVEAPRAVPLLDPGDYRRLVAYVIVAGRRRLRPENAGIFERVLNRVRFGAESGAGVSVVTRRESRIVEVLSASRRQVYEDGRLIVDEDNPLGELPVVHVQNASQPYRYEGLSEVEPLIPLQDELNTRLSDRAYRVTMQSFNMYLAKGLDFGASAPPRIGPGQIWMTDNPEAEIKAFGGDGASPSEDQHIAEIREALDKTSGVSPVVIGVVRERLGHLSSENAIRVTLTGVLSKTARKRATYGRGIERMCSLILTALDRAGVLRTDPADRRVRVEWGDALPVDERTRLTAAKAKVDLGVPAERVLGELGYATVGDAAASSAAGAD